MASTNRFGGVHSALPTPFKKSLALDMDAWAKIISLQIKDGIDGFVVAGSTGESPTLTLHEREALVKAAKLIAKDLPVIAGAGSNCTKDAIDLQMAMENAGACATLQVVPYYNKPTPRGLYEHFSAIAKAATVPIILYNAQGRTGIDLAPKTVSALMKEHENIIGIKDANTNMERLALLMESTKSIRPDFLVLCGEDSVFLPFLALGADGIISVASNLVPKEMKAIYNAVKNDHFISARNLAGKFHGLCMLLHSQTNPIPLKTILAARGFLEKVFRLPLASLSKEEEDALFVSLYPYESFKS